MKIFKTLCITAAFLGLTACDDFTEFDRDFILTEEGSIESAGDLERLLLGTYDSNGSYAGIVSINSIGTDETRIGLGNRGQGLQAHSFTLITGSGEPAGIYNSAYDVLDNANRVIRGADDFIANSNDNTNLLNQIRGEALAIRAWQHFDLLRMFAPSFDSNAPGVPLANQVFVVGEDDLSIPRSSVGEVLALINADLMEAANILQGDTNGTLRFNSNSVRALQARVALYTGNYTEAISLANQVVTAVPLVSGDTYVDMFREEQVRGEIIFEIPRDQFDNRIGTIYSDVNDDVFFSMSIDLLNEMNQAGDDRRNANLDLEDVISRRVANEILFEEDDPTEEEDDFTDEWIVGKYLGTESLTSLNNVIVLRSSEMVLISAEANARLGNLDAARNDINTLRTMRSSLVVTPAAYANQAEALTDILAERRVELAFEGHRLLDLKRFGQGINRLDVDCSGASIRARPATTCNLDAGSFRFTFPIPQAEIFANDGISDADQNPGY